MLHALPGCTRSWPRALCSCSSPLSTGFLIFLLPNRHRNWIKNVATTDRISQHPSKSFSTHGKLHFILQLAWTHHPSYAIPDRIIPHPQGWLPFKLAPMGDQELFGEVKLKEKRCVIAGVCMCSLFQMFQHIGTSRSKITDSTEACLDYAYCSVLWKGRIYAYGMVAVCCSARMERGKLMKVYKSYNVFYICCMLLHPCWCA